ncbi:hypothetical protein QE152_g39974 [Popillia japonica]|uniref:Uncharacterized protein n=1 Tax=Popillia japonica TaxID=7064 RepID=A0AAW1HSU0_POPJA
MMEWNELLAKAEKRLADSLKCLELFGEESDKEHVEEDKQKVDDIKRKMAEAVNPGRMEEMEMTMDMICEYNGKILAHGTARTVEEFIFVDIPQQNTLALLPEEFNDWLKESEGWRIA